MNLDIEKIESIFSKGVEYLSIALNWIVKLIVIIVNFLLKCMMGIISLIGLLFKLVFSKWIFIILVCIFLAWIIYKLLMGDFKK